MHYRLPTTAVFCDGVTQFLRSLPRLETTGGGSIFSELGGKGREREGERKGRGEKGKRGSEREERGKREGRERGVKGKREGRDREGERGEKGTETGRGERARSHFHRPFLRRHFPFLRGGRTPPSLSLSLRLGIRSSTWHRPLPSEIEGSHVHGMAHRVQYENSNDVGVRARAKASTYACVEVGKKGRGADQGDGCSAFEGELGDYVPVVKTSVAGTRLVGRLCVGNKNGLLMPNTATDQEMMHVRNSLQDDVVVQRIDERLSALGNCIACNDYVALVHPDVDRETEELVADVLGVEVHQQRRNRTSEDVHRRHGRTLLLAANPARGGHRQSRERRRRRRNGGQRLDGLLWARYDLHRNLRHRKHLQTERRAVPRHTLRSQRFTHRHTGLNTREIKPKIRHAPSTPGDTNPAARCRAKWDGREAGAKGGRTVRSEPTMQRRVR
eukprot:scaffold2293_cov333-Pavlova_lutheri.AAC.2